MASGGSVASMSIPYQTPGLISNSSGPYPQVSTFGPPVNSVGGIASTPSIQINYSLSTSLNITRSGGTTGAGPTTTFAGASLGYAAAVPETCLDAHDGNGPGAAFVLARCAADPPDDLTPGMTLATQARSSGATRRCIRATRPRRSTASIAKSSGDLYGPVSISR